MNNERRVAIASAIEKLRAVEAELNELAEQEQEAYDNTPESVQQGERGQAMETAVETLQECASDIDQVCERLLETTQ